MLFLFVIFFLNFTSKAHLSLNGWVILFLLLCYLDSSNKINCISSLFFEEIYILSLPIIDEFVSTVLPVALYAEDELKIRQKALKSRENTRILA